MWPTRASEQPPARPPLTRGLHGLLSSSPLWWCRENACKGLPLFGVTRSFSFQGPYSFATSCTSRGPVTGAPQSFPGPAPDGGSSGQILSVLDPPVLGACWSHHGDGDSDIH